jgi:hypothetical protein
MNVFGFRFLLVVNATFNNIFSYIIFKIGVNPNIHLKIGEVCYIINIDMHLRMYNMQRVKIVSSNLAQGEVCNIMQ